MERGLVGASQGETPLIGHPAGTDIGEDLLHPGQPNVHLPDLSTSRLVIHQIRPESNFGEISRQSPDSSS